jgi:hypothetical protein
MSAVSLQDPGLSSSVVSSRVLFYPGGIQIGNVRSPGGNISHPQLVTKTTGGSLLSADLVNSLIVVSGNAADLTLSIPNVEDILAAFAASGQTFTPGDKFEVNVARFFDLADVGDLILAILPAAPLKHAVTFASGVAPVHLFAAAAAGAHFGKLIFEITSVLTPAIKVFSIMG